MTTKGVLFDLDETLLNRKGTLLRYASDLYSELNNFVNADYDEFISLLESLDAQGRTPREIFFNELAKQGFSGISNTYLKENFYTNAWLHPTIFPGVIGFLEALRDYGIPTGIVTNGNSEIQRAKIQNSGIINYVDKILISEEFGVRKPEPEIFLHIAMELNIDPACSWFIGDDPVSDIIGAFRAGFKTIWLERHLEWPTDHHRCFDQRARDFTEIKLDTFIA